MHKSWYSRFLEGHKGLLHFAAHSHHFWPDVTRDAVLEAWDDAACRSDRKWDQVLEKLIPEAQRHVARILSLPSSRTVTFAPNTHELVVRLFSCFPPEKKLRVLTSDSEFHSFSRQTRRWEETGQVACKRVPARPFPTFVDRLLHHASNESFDIVFLSQVFFDSGFALTDLAGLVRALRAARGTSRAFLVLDGYHGFMALPTSLASLEKEIFYLAGGYKYAQAGEGACFLHAPSHLNLRPINTGWFAEFGALSQGTPQNVTYGPEAFRFWGATFDPTALYRFNAALGFFENQGLDVPAIHGHVRGLQRRFLEHLGKRALAPLAGLELVTPVDGERFGHFLAFKGSEAAAAQRTLERQGILTDVRGNVLRFGFGLYQGLDDVDELFERLSRTP